MPPLEEKPDPKGLTAIAERDLYTFVIAAAFLAIGVYIGPRELAVLHEIAAGRSNKEIAVTLNVSPNTVKTHAARLFEKLDASRRTEAINKARELGIVP